MRRTIAIGCAVGVLGLTLASVGAYGDDINWPIWRTSPPGQAPTTYQAWEFDDADNPAAPEVELNPYGTATATITGSNPYTKWKETDYGHAGVWKFEDAMLLEIPNNPVPNVTKLIWLQLTFYAAGGSDPELDVVPPPTGGAQLIAKVPLDAYYWHSTYLITVQPNPPLETIYLQPRDCTIYVDEVVVDTICFPEPASAMLLAGGAVGLLRRRR